MSIIKQNIGSIIMFVYMVLGAFLYKPEEISIALAGLLLFTAGWFLWQIIEKRLSFYLDIRKYPTEIKVIGAFFIFEIILFVDRAFFSGLSDMTYNWCILVFLFCFLYVYVYKNKENVDGLFDSVVYAGIIIEGAMLFAYAGNEDGIGWIVNLISDRAAVASWALLISIVSVMSYCFCEEKIKAWFYLLVAALSFFILCINHYCISIWLLLFVFLLIPVFFRPVAELIKRDMQMLFLFIFFLSNLSLVTNYTNFLLVDVTLNLESSVYLEMLFTVGALVFFYFWDRLPEDAALNKISMLKLQKVYSYAVGMLGCAFAIIVLWGEALLNFPDSTISKIIKRVALPIVQEMEQSRSALSVIQEYQGLIGLLFLCFFAFVLGKNIKENYDKDKFFTIAFIIISIVFVIQLFFFTPSINILPIYFICFLSAIFMKEEIREVMVIKQQDTSKV